MDEEIEAPLDALEASEDEGTDEALGDGGRGSGVSA